MAEFFGFLITLVLMLFVTAGILFGVLVIVGIVIGVALLFLHLVSLEK